MKLTLAIFLILNSIIAYTPQAAAQTKKPATTKQPSQPRKPNSPKKNPPSRIIYIPKPPRGLTSVSGRRKGMSSRNNCPDVSIPLTALVPFQEIQPGTKSNAGIVGGLTTLERPKFLFYIPYTTQNLTNSNAEFSLQDSNGIDIHRTTIPLPAKPGVMSVSIPTTVSLKRGQIYNWYFQVSCNNIKASLPVYVEGYIQRSDLDFGVAQRIRTSANSQQKIAIYAHEGIWFDALNMLLQIRQSSQDTSVEQDWQSLLQSVNLDHIITAPLVNSSK